MPNARELSSTRSVTPECPPCVAHSATAWRASVTVSSCDASSDSTISIGGKDCKQILRICSPMNCAPLNVQSATEMDGEPASRPLAQGATASRNIDIFLFPYGFKA